MCFKNEAVKVKQVATVWLYYFSQRSYTVDSTNSPLVCAIKFPGIVLEVKVALTMPKLTVLQKQTFSVKKPSKKSSGEYHGVN